MPAREIPPKEKMMAADTTDAEARIDALSAMVKSTLTTLVMRGVLTKADIPALVQESETALGEKGRHPAVRAELRAIRDDMPSFLRAALGPEPDPDEDDH
jgi:hypothetical protein